MKALVIGMVISGMLTLNACNDNAPASSSVKSLETTDVQVGTGPEATAGKSVTVHYTGWLYNENAADHHGKKFDSSRDHGGPYTFVLGEGNVIEGWDQGVVGMKAGGKRTLIIPPALGYGDAGSGSRIPPNSTLIFDVELLSVQ